MALIDSLARKLSRAEGVKTADGQRGPEKERLSNYPKFLGEDNR